MRLPLPCEANDWTTKPPKESATACASPTLSSKLPCAIPSPRLAVFTICGPTETSTEPSYAFEPAPPAPASTDPSETSLPPPVEPAVLSEPELHAATASASTSGTSSASFFISASLVTLASTGGGLRKFPTHGRLPLLRRRTCPVQRDRRTGNREQRRVSELVRGRARQLSRSLPGRLPRADRTGRRSADDRGVRPLCRPVRLRRRATDPHARHAPARRPLPLRVRHRARERATGEDRGGLDRPRLCRRHDAAPDADARLARGGHPRSGTRLMAGR